MYFGVPVVSWTDVKVWLIGNGALGKQQIMLKVDNITYCYIISTLYIPYITTALPGLHVAAVEADGPAQPVAQ